MTAGRKSIYTLNEHYFDIIDSEDKAYFLGLLYADGYNNTKRHQVFIGLIESDKKILEIFCKFLKTNKPLRIIKCKNKQTLNRLCIENTYLSKYLESIGLIHNKSFDLLFPKWLKLSLYSHFIRGYFDGDGCITFGSSIRKNKDGTQRVKNNGIPYKKHFCGTISIASSNEFCDTLKFYIENNFSIHCGINRKNKVSVLVIRGNKQIFKIMNWLYTGSTIYLERKYNKYLEYIKTWENSKL